MVSVPAVAEGTTTPLRGQLTSMPDGRPALETGPGKKVPLIGDDASIAVLKDSRLAGMDFEAIGQFNGDGFFVVRPIHTKSMFVHRNGKKLFITYWCDVCSIRTYSPGKCWCCQEDTELDLRERYDP